MRCDGGQPACSRCEAVGSQCEMSDKPTKTTYSRDIKSLGKRIKALEANLGVETQPTPASTMTNEDMDSPQEEQMPPEQQPQPLLGADGRQSHTTGALPIHVVTEEASAGLYSQRQVSNIPIQTDFDVSTPLNPTLSTSSALNPSEPPCIFKPSPHLGSASVASESNQGDFIDTTTDMIDGAEDVRSIDMFAGEPEEMPWYPCFCWVRRLNPGYNFGYTALGETFSPMNVDWTSPTFAAADPCQCTSTWSMP